jgi:3-phenylpropionate/trans-cinnamate dioxygenase ferredoxin reductase subunit
MAGQAIARRIIRVSDIPGKVVIVGAGLAGSRTAEALRAHGYEGRILLIGEESSPPYERPALSKALLSGKREETGLLLRRPEHFAELDIELMLGERVESIDIDRREATLRSGAVLDWDALVLATGARPRRLGGIETPAGVHYLRTLADALTLRAELTPGRRLAIVGAGFIGTEVASSARELGVEVAMIEVTETPLERQLGPQVGKILADRYRSRGVDLHLGVELAGFESDTNGRVRALRLSNASEIACDVALVGIGVEPAGELLGGGEIATDAQGRTEFAGVYACGDVAASWRPSLGRRLRVEHWTSAAGQAAAVARTIAGEETSHDDVGVPYFWSDQFGLRLQFVGHATSWERVEIKGPPDSFLARYLDSDGRLLAALAVNQPAQVARLRRELG